MTDDVQATRAHGDEVRGSFWPGALSGDLQFVLRSLRRSPTFTVAVVVTLAVGIGLTTAIVNVAMAILFPPVPFPEPERMFAIRQEMVSGGRYAISDQKVSVYREGASTFSALAGARLQQTNLTLNGEPRLVLTPVVTEGFFDVVGIHPSLGRGFRPDEFVPGAEGTVVVLDHEAWKAHFNGDPDILDRDILLGTTWRNVIGVLPENFRYPEAPWRDFETVGSFYLPFAAEINPRVMRGIGLFGRLRPGVTREQAQSELQTIKSVVPERRADQTTSVLRPVIDAYRPDQTKLFWVFLGAVVILYLIACSTTANMMVARTIARRRELGVRLALGAMRRRIIQLVLLESLVLSLAAAGIGLVITYWARIAMIRMLPWENGPEHLSAGLDGPTFVTAFLLAGATSIVAGSIPAWRAGQSNLNDALKEGAGSVGESRHLRRLRDGLVVLQSALAVTLLIGAGLMLQSVRRLQSVDVGFNPAGKIAFTGSRPRMFGFSREERSQLQETNVQIAERLRQLPGVKSVALSSSLPVTGAIIGTSVRLEDGAEGEHLNCSIFAISPAYFATLEQPILRGRGFEGMHPSDPRVAVVNLSFARQYFPAGEAVGQRIIFSGRPCEIVGITSDVVLSKYYLRHSDGNDLAQVYVPDWQRPGMGLTGVIRVLGQPPPDLVTSMRRAVYEIDPSVVVSAPKPFTEYIGEFAQVERYTLALLQVLSGLAFVLAASGIFSVMVYTVAQRRGEFGLRLVLGATPGSLIRLVMRRGVILAGLGVVLGAGAALGLSRVLSSLLYETASYDYPTYAGVMLLLLVAAAAACWLPARQAARVDPVVTLRAE